MSNAVVGEAAAHCKNCDAFLGDPPGKFCPKCGQDTLNHPPTFWEFVHEFITHYVALEGKLWQTLWLLFFKPAELTREYRAGRKLRYISPLRLYITASFLFFLVVKIAGVGVVVDVDSGGAPMPRKEQGFSDKTAPAQDALVNEKINGLDQKASVEFDCEAHERVCLWFKHRVEGKFKDRTAGDVLKELKTGVLSNIPYALFSLLPMFALLTKLIYHRRGLYFGEHMVYALHLHAFTFFALLLMALLPKLPSELLFLAMLGYYFIAMQRFFGGRWWINVIRYGIIGWTYPILLMIVAGVVVSAVVLF